VLPKTRRKLSIIIALCKEHPHKNPNGWMMLDKLVISTLLMSGL